MTTMTMMSTWAMAVLLLMRLMTQMIMAIAFTMTAELGLVLLKRDVYD